VINAEGREHVDETARVPFADLETAGKHLITFNNYNGFL